MWRRSLLIALILIGPAQLCATDDGRICRECGKMTMLGAKHICKGITEFIFTCSIYTS